MLSKAISKEKDSKKSEERKQRKKVHAFRVLLRETELMKEGITWDEVFLIIMII